MTKIEKTSTETGVTAGTSVSEILAVTDHETNPEADPEADPEAEFFEALYTLEKTLNTQDTSILDVLKRAAKDQFGTVV